MADTCAKIQGWVLVFSATLLASGCATITTAPVRGSASVDTETILPVVAGRTFADSGILFSYGFQGRDADDTTTCRLRLVNQDSGGSVFLNLQSADKVSYVEASPGTYSVSRMGCGIGRIWNMAETISEKIHVQGGQISYMGKLDFVFNGDEFTEVRMGSRAETASAFTDAAELPAVNGLMIVSAYTGLQVTPEMAQDVSPLGGFDVHASGVANADKILEPLMNQLQSCDKQASRVDPVRLGRLEYVAEYKSGQFSDFKERTDKDAFATSLRDCVSDSLSKFQMTSKAPVEIRVVY